MRAEPAELTAWGEVPRPRPNGRLLWVRRQSRVAARHADGSISVVGPLIAITRERSLTARMQASGKLATLGEMASGLAQ